MLNRPSPAPGGLPRPSFTWQLVQLTLLNTGPNPELMGEGAVTNVASNWPSPIPCSSIAAPSMEGKAWPYAPAPASYTVCDPPLIHGVSSAALHGEGSLRQPVAAATANRTSNQDRERTA